MPRRKQQQGCLTQFILLPLTLLNALFKSSNKSIKAKKHGRKY